jgi:hypothetical protein
MVIASSLVSCSLASCEEPSPVYHVIFSFYMTNNNLKLLDSLQPYLKIKSYFTDLAEEQ